MSARENFSNRTLASAINTLQPGSDSTSLVLADNTKQYQLELVGPGTHLIRQR